MDIDWNQVKKQTLWNYEDLINKLLKTLAYDFVQEYYNHSMKAARSYAGQVQQGYLQNKSDTTLRDNMLACFKRLEASQVEMNCAPKTGHKKGVR